MESSRKKSIFRAFSVLSSMTLVSRVTGYTRDAFIAAFLGASAYSDAFFVVYRIPNMFRRLFGEGAMTPAVVPVVTELLQKDEATRKQGIRSIIKVAVVVVGIITVLGVIASPVLVRFMAFKLKDPAIFDLAVNLNHIMFPYLFCISIVAVFMGILNASHHFFAPSFAPVLLNLSMIAGLLFLRYFVDLPVYALAWGVIIGGVLQLVFHIPYLRKEKMPFMPGGPFKTDASKQVYTLLGPMVFGLAITQINVVVNTNMAIFLKPGAVSVMYYADRLIELPMGLFTISFATAILPSVSASAINGDHDSVKRDFTRTLIYCLLMVFPSMFLLVFIGRPIISVLFQWKAFTMTAVHDTYLALLGYAWGLPFFTFHRLITPLFYAYKDTKSPVKAGLIALFVNIVMNFALLKLGQFGLASAVSIAAVVNGIILLRLFRKSHFRIGLRASLRSVVKMFLAALFAGILTGIPAIFFPFKSLFVWRLLFLCGLGLVYAAAYVILLTIFNVSEAGDVWTKLKQRFAR